MPIFLNRQPGRILPKGKRRVAPVRRSRRIALGLRAAIAAAMGPLIQEVENIIPWLQGTATPAQAAAVLQELQERWKSAFSVTSRRIGAKLVDEISKEARARLEKNLARAIGVDMTKIFDDKTVMDTAEMMSFEAASLIKDIPDVFLEEVRRAVLSNYQQLPQPEGRSLTEQIQEIIGSTEKRARTIARDQTSKIHTAINQARQQELGIEEYIWRTAKDRRVVGKPGGKYPEGNTVHGNHYAREGRVFRWDTPPHDGHPGWAINCRCYHEPVIEVSKLRNVQ